MWVISAFYKFVPIENPLQTVAELRNLCKSNGIIGTILVAPEGINGTVAGASENIRQLHVHLHSDPRFEGIETKESTSPEAPFGRLRIRLKKEIISIRDQRANPNIRVGEYVSPDDWNALISDPEVLVLDTRNKYEVEAGTFSGAIDPELNSFGEFPDYVQRELNPHTHKKVAMFCTGGIRCEKASALMLACGFENVYHLKGGILKYLEVVPENERLFKGKCFVFDGRETLSQVQNPLNLSNN